MAQWAALRHWRKLDSQQRCGNCRKQIAVGDAYCWLCAIFGGQRRVEKIEGERR